MTSEGRATEAAPHPGDICPFLLSADGGWRSATAVRDHRCTAVTPPAPLAAEKQRRLCLTAGHRTCATFLAAGDARAAVHRVDVVRRPVARTTPVVLDHARLAVTLPTIASKPHIGQGALIGVLGLAFVAVLVARLATGGPSDPAAGNGTVTPAATTSPAAGAVASEPTEATPTPGSAATAQPTPSTTASPTLVPTEGEPTPSPSAAETPATYKVKRGDSLSAIAERFGTTVKAIARLNDIEDPSSLRVGQVLKLP